MFYCFIRDTCTRIRHRYSDWLGLLKIRFGTWGVRLSRKLLGGKSWLSPLWQKISLVSSVNEGYIAKNASSPYSTSNIIFVSNNSICGKIRKFPF